MSASKRCCRCGLTKAVREFYRHSGHADGLRSECNVCNLKAVKAYQQSPRGQAKRQAYNGSAPGRAAGARYRRSPRGKAVKAHYNRSPNGKAVQARADRQHRYWYPDKINARKAVDHALQTGRLTREPCEVCGAEPAQGHHDDYSKPLEPRWLCVRCHNKLRQSKFQALGPGKSPEEEAKE